MIYLPDKSVLLAARQYSQLVAGSHNKSEHEMNSNVSHLLRHVMPHEQGVVGP